MDRPTGSSHLSFTLGTLSAVGGLAGFLKTGSVPSLVAGVGIGGFYIYGGYLINVGTFFLIMPAKSICTTPNGASLISRN